MGGRSEALASLPSVPAPVGRSVCHMEWVPEWEFSTSPWALVTKVELAGDKREARPAVWGALCGLQAKPEAYTGVGGGQVGRHGAWPMGWAGGTRLWTGGQAHST